MHMGRELGRVDDIWSLIYMLIELHCELPWQKERDKKLMAGMKHQIPDTVVLKDVPSTFFKS